MGVPHGGAHGGPMGPWGLNIDLFSGLCFFCCLDFDFFVESILFSIYINIYIYIKYFLAVLFSYFGFECLNVFLDFKEYFVLRKLFINV